LPKVNVWARPLQAREPQSRTFQDIDEETGEPRGEPFTFTFWRMGEEEDTKLEDRTSELLELYVGDPKLNVKPLMDFLPVGGKAISVTRNMCINAAVMECMQPASLPDEDRYDADEIIALRAGLAEKTRQDIATFIHEVRQPKKKAIVVAVVSGDGTKTSCVSA
jgi:hypothetical protein